MTVLDRLLATIRRTGLPAMIQSSDAEEPCVILPLHVYERLVAIEKEDQPKVRHPKAPIVPSISDPAPETSLDALLQPPEPIIFEPMIEPAPESIPGQPLSLGDLLAPRVSDTSSLAKVAKTVAQPSSEDTFAFSGADIKILPTLKQKIATSPTSFDEFGQTLA